MARAVLSDRRMVFEDLYSLTLRDTWHDAVEDRFITLGALVDEVIAFVVHTSYEANGEEVIHLISAREATKRERKIYETAHQRTAQRYRRARRNKRRRH